MNVTIQLAKLSEAPEIVRLLNQVTMDLFEKGIRQWGYPWRLVEIKKEIGRGNLYIVKEQEQVIGSFSLKTVSKIVPLTIQKKCLYLKQIAIAPQFQSSGFGKEVVAFSKEQALINNLALYFKCEGTNEKLQTFFTNCECDPVGEFVFATESQHWFQGA